MILVLGVWAFVRAVLVRRPRSTPGSRNRRWSVSWTCSTISVVLDPPLGVENHERKGL